MTGEFGKRKRWRKEVEVDSGRLILIQGEAGCLPCVGAHCWCGILPHQADFFDIITAMKAMTSAENCATLSSEGAFTLFSYGGKCIKFASPYSLKRYIKIKTWDRGYIEVDTEYTHGIVEEYIDLEPILENLYIRPSEFLKPIKRVEVRYARSKSR